MPSPSPRVLLIGLDAVPPELLFSCFLNELPNIRSLVEGGVSGPLRSTIPPITVPAWMSMVTGKDPGSLGIYGLRNRADRSYDQMRVASSRLVKEAPLWDILEAHDKRVILVGVPLTYPPTPVNGCLVASFLTPGPEADYTYPSGLKEEIDQVVDGYELDVADFRTDDKPRLLEAIYRMTRKRFEATRHLMSTREWDFVMHVEMGTDRIHHGFWRHHDPSHRGYDPASPFTDTIRDYYRYLDSEIASLVDLAGPETTVVLASDHGTKRIDGGICVNEWLIREGYLKVDEMPESPTPIESLNISWRNTSAWGYGGYYARIFLNVAGREPDGIVSADDYENVRTDLARKLSQLTDPEGRPLATKVFKPQDVYARCEGIPPDLIVYFGDLHWRSNGTVGGGSIYSAENDTGPDDSNHSEYGVFVMKGVTNVEPGSRDDLSILDVAPTVLSVMDIPVPDDMQGRSIVQRASGSPADVSQSHPADSEPYSADEQQQVMDRLKSLGYL